MKEQNYQNIVDFLILAKKKTYASFNGQNRILNASDGTVRYEYGDGEFSYVDTYAGTKTFAGMEVVYYRKEAVWAMVYYGGITVPEVKAGEVYTFLKKALGEVTSDAPFRGPESFRLEEYLYENRFEGGFNKFHGDEQISQKKQLVYDLKYSGGTII